MIIVVEVTINFKINKKVIKFKMSSEWNTRIWSVCNINLARKFRLHNSFSSFITTIQTPRALVTLCRISRMFPRDLSHVPMNEAGVITGGCISLRTSYAFGIVSMVTGEKMFAGALQIDNEAWINLEWVMCYMADTVKISP